MRYVFYNFPNTINICESHLYNCTTYRRHIYRKSRIFLYRAFSRENSPTLVAKLVCRIVRPIAMNVGLIGPIAAQLQRIGVGLQRLGAQRARPVAINSVRPPRR